MEIDENETAKKEKILKKTSMEEYGILCRLEKAYRKVDLKIMLDLSSDFCSLQEKWDLAVNEHSKEVISFLRANGELEEEETNR